MQMQTSKMNFLLLQRLSGNGHDENGIVDENICRLRFGRANFWMKTLRTNFPYGPDEMSRSNT